MFDVIIDLIGTALCYGMALLLIILVAFFFICCEREKNKEANKR